MLKVYNTLSREKEEFRTVEKGKVKMYVCGLTVQNYSHLGHIRSAVNYDVIRRYLQHKGYLVIFIQNFTDINEKIAARAAEENISTEELAEKYSRAYLEDIQALNIERATHYVKATDHINDIIKMIDTLIDRGYAYEINGNVYFSVDKFKGYGKLSGRSLEEMQAGARIEVNQEKKNPLDFALWKKAPEDEKMWNSPWGKGWPGWHIECSAMSTKYLGESFDIHGGGTDLIFPHHENEIAQSEACTGKKPFARYWMHNGSVNLKGEKMSKSLGNFFTTRELLNKYNSDVIRYFLITKHYRSPIDFSLNELENASSSLQGLNNTLKAVERLLKVKNDELIENFKGSKQELTPERMLDVLKKHRKNFEDAMDDDFNTARASGVLHELTHNINSYINDSQFKLTLKTKAVVQEAYILFSSITDILGLTFIDNKIENQNIDNNDSNKLMEIILTVRKKARNEKNYELADFIRNKLKSLGYIVKDTPQGSVWERESD